MAISSFPSITTNYFIQSNKEKMTIELLILDDKYTIISQRNKSTKAAKNNVSHVSDKDVFISMTQSYFVNDSSTGFRDILWKLFFIDEPYIGYRKFKKTLVFSLKFFFIWRATSTLLLSIYFFHHQSHFSNYFSKSIISCWYSRKNKLFTCWLRNSLLICYCYKIK